MGSSEAGHGPWLPARSTKAGLSTEHWLRLQEDTEDGMKGKLWEAGL